MKKLLFFTALISAVTLAGVWSGKNVCHLMSGSDAAKNVYASLALSPEQERAIKPMESAFRKAIYEDCMRICRERAAMLRDLKEGAVGTEEAKRKVEAVGRLQIELDQKILTHIEGLKKILNPSQMKTYIDELYQEQYQMTPAHSKEQR